MSVAKKLDERYNYADYLTWTDEDERWEIIEGVPYMMSPSPTRKHQKVSMQLSLIIGNYLKEKSCEIYSAPFDVRLLDKSKYEDEIFTVVQPDISVICDKEKLDEKGCLGSPDMIIEILSPSTAKKDKIDKFYLYEKYGVKEYWLVELDNEIITVFKLQNNGLYGRPDIYSVENKKIKVGIFDDLEIDLEEVFGKE